MKTYTVVFAPEVQDDLLDRHAWIAERAAPSVAARYTQAIVDLCESLSPFPKRGAPRDEVRPGLRITHHKRRTVVADAVDDDARAVSILGVFHGGRDYRSALAEYEPDGDVGPR